MLKRKIAISETGKANHTRLVLCASAKSAALPTSVTACTMLTISALLLLFIAWNTPLIIIIIPEMIAVIPMIRNAGIPMASISSVAEKMRSRSAGIVSYRMVPITILPDSSYKDTVYDVVE